MNSGPPPHDSGHHPGSRPESGARAPDRRVERTRRTLHQALISLALERPWDEISVKDVCDAANVGRSTFYAHFADKEELLSSGFDHLGVFLRAAIRDDVRTDRVLKFVHPLVVHMLEYRSLFRALIGKHSGRVIQRRFRLLVFELVSEALTDLRGVPDETTARFVTGGVCEVLSVVIDTRSPVVEQVDDEVQRLVGPIVRG